MYEVGDEFICVETINECYTVGGIYPIIIVTRSRIWPYVFVDGGGVFSYEELNGEIDSLDVCQARFRPTDYYTDKALFTIKMTGRIPNV